LLCNNNLLSSLPELPAIMDYLNCSSNSGIFCLPELKTITDLNFINCSIACIPNYGNVTTSNPPLNSLPICDIFNGGGCNFYWNIAGETFLDADSNCVQSPFENGMMNMHIILYQNNNLIQQAFTGGEGFYSFDVNNFGNYEIQLDTA